MEDDEKFCRKRLLEEDLRAVGAQSEELRKMHLAWATLYEERLRSFAERKSATQG